MDIKKAKNYQNEFLERSKNLPKSDLYTFLAAYNNLVTQIRICEELNKSIKEEGGMVSKEYVKGRPSLTVHPGIAQFNSTTKAMSSTISTIYKILERETVPETETASILNKLKEKNI